MVAMRALYGLAMVTLLFVLAVPSGLDSCAIAPPAPVFTAKHRPADVQAFVKGHPGVVQGPMQRRYLIGAYRMLAGVPLSDREAAALYPGKKPSVAASPEQSENWSPVRRWLEARTRIPATTNIDSLPTNRYRTTADAFVSYDNCLDDAFTSAKRTLEARAKLWGDGSSNLKTWLAAQDQVFSNCAGEQAVIPAAPAPGMGQLLAADRRYQIAAALFYAGSWQKARQSFEAIAADTASPWHEIAPYLAGRTLLREATVDGRPEAFDEAGKRFTAILQDTSRRDWHEPSRKMLDLIRNRKDPAGQLKLLGERLTQRNESADVGAAATDFVYLYGRGDQPPAGAGELAAWMDSVEGRSTAAAKRWRETGNPAWLVAALSTPAKDDPTELVVAARKVPPGSPAYESAAYYGIEREMQSGHLTQARDWADEALRQNLLLSTRNLILGQRMKLARDWTEFLRFAPRRPEPHMVNEDGAEEETDQPPAGTQPILDADSVAILNSLLPLSLWIDAAANRLLPTPVQLQIAEAGWIRALLLGRDADAHALLQRVVQLKPAYAPAAQPFLSAKNADEERFVAVLMLMRSPDVVPDLDGGNAAPDLTKTSTLGGGRWCFNDAVPHDEDGRLLAAPDFLTAAQKAAAAAERKALHDTASSGANYLAAQTIAWARSHAGDPRIPEALHFAVQTTRRGCTDAATGTYSKEAFDLLHREYPKSPWTARTPYWYK
jgi:hypothetical protein